MTKVELHHLSRQFGTVRAVDDLTLTVNSGELVALLGPSGCGKTTTMRMLAGLLAPSTGDIHFDGRSVLRIPPERRGAVMVFQKHLLFPHMNVADNVGFGLKMRGVAKAEIERRVREMLALVQLPGFEGRRAHALSGGQQQRVALARALVIEPTVLLLDEPLANLDANLRLEMRKLIREIQQTLKITTIFVTHDQEEAVMLADRVALMIEGRLQQYAEPRTFYEQPASAQVAHFFRNDNFLPGKKQGNIVKTAVGPLAIHHDTAVPDGAVLLTLRPEQIRLASATGVDDSEQSLHSIKNRVAATVLTIVYMGTYLQLTVALGGQSWRVHFPAGSTVAVGEELMLYLPPEQLWCVAATAS